MGIPSISTGNIKSYVLCGTIGSVGQECLNFAEYCRYFGQFFTGSADIEEVG